MHVIGSGFIHNGNTAPEYQQSCARTTITSLHDGTLMATCRLDKERDTLGGHHGLFVSSDLGETWEMRSHSRDQGSWGNEPGEVLSFTPMEHEPGVITATGLWLDRSRPEFPMANPGTQGFLPMRIFHTTSTDGGRTWDKWRLMDTSPHLAASCATQGTWLLPTGEWAQPYEKWKEYDDVSQGVPGCWYRISADNGATWPEYRQVAQHPDNELFYWDLRLTRHLETGQWVAIFWTHERATGNDLDNHISWGTSDARSWTTPIGTGLRGQHCQPIALGGERLLAVFPNRELDPPGICASISEDFGKSWDREKDLVVYASGVGIEPGASGGRTQKEKFQDMKSWRFGHPRGVLLSDGTVFVVFYAGDDVVKSACWARLQV